MKCSLKIHFLIPKKKKDTLSNSVNYWMSPIVPCIIFDDSLEKILTSNGNFIQRRDWFDIIERMYCIISSGASSIIWGMIYFIVNLYKIQTD